MQIADYRINVMVSCDQICVSQNKVINFIPEIQKGISATYVKNENSVFCSQLTGPVVTLIIADGIKVLKFALSDTCTCDQENLANVNLAVFQCV